ncbi:hypothetical protein [Mesorhizobium sp. M7D.F.Ca.US.005.01.1.1]|nr:hypothetical protein [Mesorhizobium sp. M7D.F.Ca.US.005.01.1.1]
MITVTCIDGKPNSYDQPIVTSSAATAPVFPAESLMRISYLFSWPVPA